MYIVLHPTQVASSAENTVGDENCDKIGKENDPIWILLASFTEWNMIVSFHAFLEVVGL